MFGNSGAFECHTCPGRNKPTDHSGKFCPAWWQQPWYDKDGKEYIREDCAFRLLPEILTVLGKTSTLAMSTAHEMNGRLDKAEKLCDKVSNEMNAIAKVMYLAIEAKEAENGRIGTDR